MFSVTPDRAAVTVACASIERRVIRVYSFSSTWPRVSVSSAWTRWRTADWFEVPYMPWGPLASALMGTAPLRLS